MKFKIIMFSIFFLITLVFNFFGLMRLFPLYITAPIFFFSIYIGLQSFFYRKKFRGFQQ
ncbi:hypothetical protein [Thalassobacillus sp. CUG 92003]|uniref:hypothetical protein n=1 Tax=Thalassobacillus sp. CUG 92003 TaxID=2736641 RepID=UPI0015E79A29|nr:hypothetical protein [Thalassobacillus sp. CUG 92003]